MTPAGVHTELREGLERFNRGRFWDAHEAWEEVWLRWPDPDRRFVQGLIQLAAAWHHVTRGNDRGARRLFEAAVAKLRPFPPGFLGIDREECQRIAAMLAESEHPSQGAPDPPLLLESAEGGRTQ